MQWPVKQNPKPKQKQIRICRPYAKQDSRDQNFDVKKSKEVKQIV